MSIRVPVVYKRKPLMPMRWRRARLLIKENKATLKYTKDGIIYLRLNFEPSGYNTQPIHIGIDTGSHFDGITVTSKTCHHENLELVHTKGLKELGNSRRGNRRIRRSRLRHRKIRFSNRTASKVTITIRSMVNFRKYMITQLTRLYPISKAIVERVAYRGPNQFSFTQVHQGQNELVTFLKSLSLRVHTVKGYITKRVRVSLFGEDLKDSNKGAKNFFAHCLDSFAISTIGLRFVGKLNQVTRFVSKVWLNRRELFRVRALSKGKWEYFRYGKGGVKKTFTKLGKVNVCRVKLEGEYSNHPKLWTYIDNGRATCYKCNQPRPYGGTKVVGQSRVPIPRGLSKRVIWSGNSWDVTSGKVLGYRNRKHNVIGGCANSSLV